MTGEELFVFYINTSGLQSYFIRLNYDDDQFI